MAKSDEKGQDRMQCKSCQGKCLCLIVCLVCTMLALSGCVQSASAHEEAVQAVTRVAMVLDSSGSTYRFELPLPTPSQIGHVADQIIPTGGELQLFFVRESGHTVGERLSLPLPILKPRPPQLSGNSFSPQDASRRQEYNRELDVYRAQEAQRLQECNRRINAFLVQLASEVSGGRKSRRSAVRESLYFAIRFLNAPSRVSVQKLLVILSDCREDSPESPKFNLPLVEGLPVLWVNPEPGTEFPIPGAHPQLFVTTEQALEYAASSLQPLQPALQPVN